MLVDFKMLIKFRFEDHLDRFKNIQCQLALCAFNYRKKVEMETSSAQLLIA